MEIALAPEIEELIAQQLAEGRYASASELVGEAIKLLDRIDHEGLKSDDELRAEIAIGVAEADRGELEPFDLEDIRREGLRLLEEERRNAP